MTEARRLWAVLDILDRQLLDREGRFAGTVDDVDLEMGDDGSLTVTALLAGPGVLARRMGRRRFGPWMERFSRWAWPGDDDPNRIPLARVADIGSAIKVSLDHADMGSAITERWFRDHVINHIPGSRREAE
jgi:hypothetical protein